MKLFFFPGAVLFFFLLCHSNPAAAEKLEIDRESDGIHIIQKRTPRQLPEQPPEPETETEGQKREEGNAEQAKPNETGKEQQETKKPQSVEDNPEYIKEINKVVDQYNRRLQNLQSERNRLTSLYNDRSSSLRQQILTTEQAMALAEKNYQRERFEQLQDLRLTQIRRLQRLESNWRDTQNELARRENELSQWRDRREREIKRKYQSQMRKQQKP